MNKFNEVKSLLEGAEKDAEAFYAKGNKAAGTRLRGAMQQLKVLASDIRKEVTDKKNAAQAPARTKALAESAHPASKP